MLAEQASATKQGGQELVGGLDVRVLRNRFGTQMQSFVAGLDLDFLGELGEAEAEGRSGPFRAVFIRAPVVEEIIASAEGGKGKVPVEVLGVYRGEGGGKGEGKGDIVAVRQGNVFGTSFHPELTDDVRIHAWWLRQVVDAFRHGELAVKGA
jgi:5'-phosphate synthase pdxT subunit